MTTEVIAPAEIKSDELFIGLKAYSEAQSDIFFGRDEEIKTLYRLIKANTITIVFGKSGTGKLHC
jgi:ABC-type phosphate transport system ATPase subunit